LGTPCERNARREPYTLSCFDFPVIDPVFCDVALVVVVADGSCATPDDLACSRTCSGDSQKRKGDQ